MSARMLSYKTIFYYKLPARVLQAITFRWCGRLAFLQGLEGRRGGILAEVPDFVGLRLSLRILG